VPIADIVDSKALENRSRRRKREKGREKETN
jgi:hypothetical protein